MVRNSCNPATARASDVSETDIDRCLTPRYSCLTKFGNANHGRARNLMCMPGLSFEIVERDGWFVLKPRN